MMEYIDDQKSLAKAYEEWKQLDEFGIDLECENNHRHYGAYLSLIQISAGKDWILDVLKVKDISLMIKILNDKSKLKIFHNTDFDFRILNYQFKCHPRNIFDTQLAAEMLGKTDIGLGPLLKEYYQIDKEKKYQRADWTKRPISEEMLDYAMNDSRYLLRLKEKLTQELEQSNKLSWFNQEMVHLEDEVFDYKDPDYNEVRGFKALEPKAKGIFRRFFNLRKNLAKLVDRPVHFIIPNKILLGYAQEPPKDWSQLRGVHPIVRKRVREFSMAVRKGSVEPIVEKRSFKRLHPDQRKRLDELTDRRNAIALKNKLPGHLILTKDQMLDMIVGKNVPLREWQKSLLNSS